MKVLIACEESQAIATEYRKRGHEAFSCDIQECSGGHPEWHIKKDVLGILNPNTKGISFETLDGEYHQFLGKWDILIAHPPCTFLTNSGNRWYDIIKYGDKALRRIESRVKAIDFFMSFVQADCERIAIENPIGIMSTMYRKPDQIVQPYFFGDPHQKSTCLWLKGLPPLVPTDIVKPQIITMKNGGKMSKFHYDTFGISDKEERSRIRSKTFPGIASAIAEQWQF